MSRPILDIDAINTVLSVKDDVKVTDHDAGGAEPYLYCETALCYFVFYSGLAVRIGVRKTFDRWANSTDFVCRWPLSESDIHAMVKVADELADKKSKDDWTVGEDEDITGLLRKAKRELG